MSTSERTLPHIAVVCIHWQHSHLVTSCQGLDLGFSNSNMSALLLLEASDWEYKFATIGMESYSRDGISISPMEFQAARWESVARGTLVIVG